MGAGMALGSFKTVYIVAKTNGGVMKYALILCAWPFKGPFNFVCIPFSVSCLLELW